MRDQMDSESLDSGRQPCCCKNFFQESAKNGARQMRLFVQFGLKMGAGLNRSTRARRFEGTRHIASVVLLIK